MYLFGKRSLNELSTVHEDLKKIMHLAIRWSSVDFGISEGHRSIERQFQLYLAGRSTIDGRNVKGLHNYNPSLAVDIFTYHPTIAFRRKMAYDKVHLAYIAGIVQSAALHLYQAGDIKHLIRWGANWDRDGIIDFDQDFDDYPHFEIYLP